MKSILLASALALSGCTLLDGIQTPDDRAFISRQLPSVYAACPECSRRIMSDGTIWELRK